MGKVFLNVLFHVKNKKSFGLGVDDPKLANEPSTITSFVQVDVNRNPPTIPHPSSRRSCASLISFLYSPKRFERFSFKKISNMLESISSKIIFEKLIIHIIS